MRGLLLGFLFLAAQTKANFAAFAVNVENYEFFALVQGKDLLGINIVAAAKLRDMHQCLDSRANLDKGAKRRNPRDCTFDFLAFFKLLNLVEPRIFGQLLDAQAQTVFVNRDNFSFNRLADFDVIIRITNTLPADL